MCFLCFLCFLCFFCITSLVCRIDDHHAVPGLVRRRASRVEKLQGTGGFAGETTDRPTSTPIFVYPFVARFVMGGVVAPLDNTFLL